MPKQEQGAGDRDSKALAAGTRIEPFILLVRGQKVMLDVHLAMLYEVETRTLVQAVKRNIGRFPPDFMFQLSWEEASSLRSQFVTLNGREAASEPQPLTAISFGTGDLRSQIVISKARGGRRYAPYAFTEQGVAVLSSVLRSPRAVQVNVEIMRTFVRLRGILAAHKDLAKKMDELEQKYDRQFAVVFEAIRQMMELPDAEVKGKIGFKTDVRNA
jgi:citrate lyase beta subunit